MRILRYMGKDRLYVGNVPMRDLTEEEVDALSENLRAALSSPRDNYGQPLYEWEDVPDPEPDDGGDQSALDDDWENLSAEELEEVQSAVAEEED